MSDEAQHEQRNLEAARIAHADHLASMANEFNMVGSFSNAAMKAPAIAAAGGIAGVLGLFSANAQDLRGVAASDLLTSALIWFFAAVFICVILPALAYLSQTSFVQSSSKHTFHYEHPHVRDTNTSRVWKRIGLFFQFTAIVMTAGSIIALAVGGWYFLQLAQLASSG